ncbi:MAG: sigma-70 family RNA polymerase sigma factor [Terriglobales bacterium]
MIGPYERAVYLAARSVVESDLDAEEVAQDAILKAYAKLPRYGGNGKFSAWLVRITLKEAHKRAGGSKRPIHELGAQPSADAERDYVPRDLGDWREIPLQALAKRETRQALTRALHAVESKYREVFVLRDVQKLTTSETAEILAIPETTVKKWLLSARLQMRDALARSALLRGNPPKKVRVV